MNKNTLTKGEVSKVKLNVSKEKKNGDIYKVHVLTITDEEGDEQKFSINVKSPPAKFVADLEAGQKVAVKQEDGKFGLQVVAVFVDRPKRQFPATQRKPMDATGPIQGNILTNAVNLVAAGKGTEDTLSASIIEAAKQILIAKAKVDKLVIQSIKDEKEDNDSDEDDSDSDVNVDDEDEDEEDSKPRKKKKSDSPY